MARRRIAGSDKASGATADRRAGQRPWREGGSPSRATGLRRLATGFPAMPGRSYRGARNPLAGVGQRQPRDGRSPWPGLESRSPGRVKRRKRRDRGHVGSGHAGALESLAGSDSARTVKADRGPDNANGVNAACARSPSPVRMLRPGRSSPVERPLSTLNCRSGSRLRTPLAGC